MEMSVALELVEEEFRRVRVAKVERDGFHRDAVRLQFGGDLREFVGAARDEDEIVTIAGEEFGEFVSDAAGCAGDENGLDMEHSRKFHAPLGRTAPPFPLHSFLFESHSAESLLPTWTLTEAACRSAQSSLRLSLRLLYSGGISHQSCTAVRLETEQPGTDFVRASGKCAECHSRLQYSVVHEYEMSKHAQKGVNCLECHQPAQGQEKKDHHGFVIARARLTAANCRRCHEQIYQQFARSRHAATSWAAIYGEKGLTPEQVSFSEHISRAGRSVRRIPL